MNLWILNHYALPPSEPGGTRHYSLAYDLTRLGHDVTLIAAGFNHFTRRDILPFPSNSLTEPDQTRFDHTSYPPPAPRCLYLPVPSYSSNSLGRIRSMLAFARQVEHLAPTPALPVPDVVLGSSPHLFAAKAALLLSRRLGARFILEVRDLWPDSLIQVAGASRWHPFVIYLAALERRLYRDADHVITLLPFAAEHIAARGGDPHRIMYVPNGFDPALFPEPPPEPSAPPFTVTYAGSHGTANALDQLLVAAAIIQRQSCSTVRFNLVGDGPMRPSLKAQAKQLGLQNVLFLDPVPKSAIVDHLHQSHASIAILKPLPIYRHGISLNKLFDYLAAGRPLILAGQPRNNPVSEAQAGITVPPESPEALAKAILDLSKASPAERAAMGQRGRGWVHREHSYPHLAGKIDRVLHSL